MRSATAMFAGAIMARSVVAGGQFADANQIVCNARRGYAGLSINWGEKPITDSYRRVVDKPDTDWGVIHPSHAGHGSHLRSLKPDDKTVDNVEAVSSALERHSRCHGDQPDVHMSD